MAQGFLRTRVGVWLLRAAGPPTRQAAVATLRGRLDHKRVVL
jgi:hypothetical protein